MTTPNGRAEIEAMFGNPANADGTLNEAWESANTRKGAPPDNWQLFYQTDTGLVPVRASGCIDCWRTHSLRFWMIFGSLPLNRLEGRQPTTPFEPGFISNTLINTVADSISARSLAAVSCHYTPTASRSIGIRNIIHGRNPSKGRCRIGGMTFGKRGVGQMAGAFPLLIQCMCNLQLGLKVNVD